MKKRLLYILLVCAFSACQQSYQEDILLRPVADFYIKNGNCKAPCITSFGNTSKGNADMQFLWDFGDGDTSRLENPAHIYEKGGVYNIQLTATNKAGFGFANRSVTIQSDLPVGFFELCRVDKITYVKVPLTKPDGKPWDDLPGSSALPDLQWLIKDTTRTYIRSQELAELVNFDQRLLPFTVPREGLSGSLRQFSQYYTLIVQDADQSGEDILGSFRFRPIDYFPAQPDNASVPSNFQREFTLKTPEGLEIIVTLTWR